MTSVSTGDGRGASVERRSFPSARPSRGAGTIAVLLGIVTIVLGTASSAWAATDSYCTECRLQPLTKIREPSLVSLEGSYIHYLGGGERLIAAYAEKQEGVAYGYKEAFESFPCCHNDHAEAANLNESYSILVNAHADIWEQ